MTLPLSRRVTSEFLGAAFLVSAVVGSGIMGERLAGGNVAIALLANTIATGAALVALILTFGPISGAHFNPAVTLADAIESGILWREVPIYITAQFAGGILGAVLAHLMFGLRWYSLSTHVRSGWPLVLSEFRDLGLHTNKTQCNPVRRRSLHHFRVLVYRLHFLR
jgi:glycerol uptake facilitator-like aquaporin